MADDGWDRGEGQVRERQDGGRHQQAQVAQPAAELEAPHQQVGGEHRDERAGRLDRGLQARRVEREPDAGDEGDDERERSAGHRDRRCHPP